MDSLYCPVHGEELSYEPWAEYHCRPDNGEDHQFHETELKALLGDDLWTEVLEKRDAARST